MLVAQVVGVLLFGSSVLLIMRWLWRRLRRHENRLVRELASARTRSQKSLSQSGVTAFAVDASGTVLWFDGAELGTWGLNAERCTGRDYREAFASWPDLVADVQRGLRGTRVDRRESGTDASFDVALRVVQNERGRLGEVVGTISNVTAEARELERAERLARFRTQFLRAINHQLRTPMASITGVAELLAESAVDEEDRELVGLIQSSSETLLRFVNELVDFGELDAGTLALESAPFDLRQVVEAACERHRPAASAHGVAIVLRYPPTASEHFVGDMSRVTQIVENLVSNAVEFTKSGHVLVDVVETGRHLDETTLRLSVEDSGPGIEADRLEHLFEGYGSDDAATGAAERTALGLPISKRLAEQMGGALEAESTPGRGSVFTLTLDLPRATSIDLPDAGAQPSALRVLVAEDSETQQKIAVQILRSLGHHVDAVSNGVEALRMAEHRAFDVVLMDCEMPEMDGYEATVAIRALPGPAASVPIVAMTANTSPEGFEKCTAAGMDAHLSKPAKRDALERVLRRVLATRDSGGHVALDAAVLQTLGQLDGGETLAELIDAFLESAPLQLTALDDSVTAGDPGAGAEALGLLETSARLLGARHLEAACGHLRRAQGADGSDAARKALVETRRAFATLAPLLREADREPANRRPVALEAVV